MKLSSESGDSKQYHFNLSLNPLFQFNKKIKKRIATQQWNFLNEDNLKSFGSKKSQYQNEIRDNHLDKPLRQIIHVLQNTKNLRRSDIYEIFNASNLESLFSSMLRDTKLNSRDTVHGYKYDFRTCENARVMLEESLNYLLNSTEFKDRKSTIENCKEVREDFKLLSKSQLSKEHQRITMNLSKDEMENFFKQQEKIIIESDKIHDKLDGIIAKVVSITNLPDSIEYKAIGKALEQTREIVLLKLTRINIEPKKTISNKKEYAKLIQEVEDLEEGLKLIKNLENNENKMIELERKLYDEIQYYFSPINSIKNNTEFENYKIEPIGDLS